MSHRHTYDMNEKEQLQLAIWIRTGSMTGEYVLKHHSECPIYKYFICTCGLIYSLKSLGFDRACEVYPSFEKEGKKHEGAVSFVERSRSEIDRYMARIHARYLRLRNKKRKTTRIIPVTTWHLRCIEDEIEEVAYDKNMSFRAIGRLKNMLYWIYDLVSEYHFKLQRPAIEEEDGTIAFIWLNHDLELTMKFTYRVRKDDFLIQLTGPEKKMRKISMTDASVAEIIQEFLEKKEDI